MLSVFLGHLVGKQQVLPVDSQYKRPVMPHFDGFSALIKHLNNHLVAGEMA